MVARDFNIAIVGAGIGGLGLAIGLSHLNIPFTLYESAPQFSAIGAGIGLGPNALRAMDMIDKRFSAMYKAIATGNPSPGKKHLMMEAMRLENGLGEGEGWWGHGGWGADHYERTAVHRKDLLDIMTLLIKKDAVRFDKKCRTIEQTDGEVTLTFEDGEVAQHAAMIACDGVRGLSRRLVLGERYPECVEPHYTNKYVYRAVIPMADAKIILGDLAVDAKMYMSKGANISTYPISKGSAINVVAFKTDKQSWPHPESTQCVSREDMMNDFSSCNPDPRLMKLLDWAQPTRWAITHHPDTPTYYKSLICMLGDVAHASGPHQGAGAGQCLEDALVLSRVLGKLYHSIPSAILSAPCPVRTKTIKAAFQAYEEVRRPRAQRQVLTSHECGDIYTLTGHAAGDDIPGVVAQLHGRFDWIWLHDLPSDVRRVETRFVELVGVKPEQNCRL